jgi:nucleotide-binding universal stress UspA family protein
MVHLDGSPEDEVRLAHAEAIAASSDAHLLGVYTNVLPDPIAYSVEFGAASIAALEERTRREGVDTGQRLAQRFERLGVRNELRSLDRFFGTIGGAVAREARSADVFVASCPRPGEGCDRWEGLVEDVLFDSGRSLYLVPPGLPPRSPIRTVMVAWADTREVARAISEALPLLTMVSVVELAHVQRPSRSPMGGAEAMADIAAHLARHGIDTRIRMVEGSSVSAALLEAAHRASADLIVAGAYGHSRLREWLVGGTTRDLLTFSDLPLLLAH